MRKNKLYAIGLGLVLGLASPCIPSFAETEAQLPELEAPSETEASAETQAPSETEAPSESELPAETEAPPATDAQKESDWSRDGNAFWRQFATVVHPGIYIYDSGKSCCAGSRKIFL